MTCSVPLISVNISCRYDMLGATNLGKYFCHNPLLPQVLSNIQYRQEWSNAGSTVGSSVEQMTPSGQCSASTSTPIADAFIPGAISNRTLETLTESSMRPYRAIRGDHRQATYCGSRYLVVDRLRGGLFDDIFVACL